MFNKDYWKEKKAREKLKKGSFSVRALRMLSGMFWTPSDKIRDAIKQKIFCKKRSQKERLKRRQRHASMMRNHA
jgi:hypothetical protein